MQRFLLVGGFLCARVLAAGAGELQVGFHFGQTFPTFEQSFIFEPDPIPSPIPGVAIEQTGAFRLDAAGGPIFAANVAYFPASFVGIEGRIDVASLDVRAQEPRFNAVVDLPFPLSDFTTALDLGAGDVQVDGLRPLSLNVKLRTPGVVRLTASGGLSILPDLRVTATQNVALDVAALDVFAAEIDVIPIQLRATASPEGGDAGEGRFGYNAGVGIEVRVAPHVSVAGEGRYFQFQKRTLRWAPVSASGGGLDSALLAEIDELLEPIEFEPFFFQATLGVVVSF